jgi:hypothetical protein
MVGSCILYGGPSVRFGLKERDDAGEDGEGTGREFGEIISIDRAAALLAKVWDVLYS